MFFFVCLFVVFFFPKYAIGKQFYGELIPLEKGSIQKGKNLPPRPAPTLGAYSFKVDLYQKGIDVQKSKQEVTKLSFFSKNGEILPLYIYLKLMLERRFFFCRFNSY